MRFEVLGRLRVIDRRDASADDAAGLHLGGTRQQLVLAILLAAPNSVVSTDALVDRLWGDSPPSAARHTLQGYVSELRKLLGPVIERAGSGYAVRVDSSSLDSLEFEKLITRGRAQLANDPLEAAATLGEGLRLWRGSPFTGFDDSDVLLAERTRLEELRLLATEDRVSAELLLGRHREIAAELDSLSHQYPYREGLRAQHMLALYRSGQSLVDARPWFVALVLLTASCASSATAPAGSPTSSTVPVTTASPVATTDTPPTSGNTTSLATTTTSIATPAVDRAVLAGISMTSVPADVIVPTTEASLDEVTNPINGRRGARRPLLDDLDCVTGTTPACLSDVLDMLGFDVTSGSTEDRERRVRRATAVVQLDAGLPMTGVADDDLLEYLGGVTGATPDDRAGDTRQIGTSSKGRPIMAMRYGDGPRTVLVVGQTHGDEEGGLRIVLRVRSLPPPDEVTMWVVPTMNPDGLALDTRFLADGADPNREAPSQVEQQAVYAFAREIRPSLTVWYHQNYGWVGGSGASTTPARQYQELTGLGTLKRSGDCTRGFMWCPIDDQLGSSSILVELPDVLTPADVQLHSLALLAVASGDAP